MKTPLLLAVCMTLAACGGSETTPGPTAKAATPAVAALTLAQAPANAIGVKAAKDKGPAADVTVTGRLYDITSGFAVMKLMDLAIPYCGETNKEDTCKTPWDYCCEGKDTQSANALLVEARGADGKPLASPSLGDLRLLDKVTVTGKLEKDEHGNFVLLAKGWHRTERPKVPDDLQWPQ